MFRAATSQNPRSIKDERKKIKQNQQEFLKAYKERFGRQKPFTRITPNPIKLNPAYNLVETTSKRLIPYESVQKRRIRQQQIDFIRDYERKVIDERLSSEDIEQQNRIRQEQLDYIREFDRKLEDSYVSEQEAIDEAYEESVRRKELQKREEEAARRAAGLRSTATYAGTTSQARGVGYNRISSEAFERKKARKEMMTSCFYRFCCKLYCFFTVILIMAITIFYYA